MKKIIKNSLLLMISFVMLITIIPMWETIAYSQEVDLIMTDDGKLKEGVFFSFNGDEYEYSSTKNDNMEKAYDGNTNSSWVSKWEPETHSYIQVNFPVSHKLTQIKLMMNGDTWFRDYFKVFVSNDVDFDEALEVYDQASTVLDSGTWLEIDMTGYEESYRYVRVIRTSSNYKFLNIAELCVYGYESPLPDTSEDVLISGQVDVTAESSEVLGKSYVAHNVLDGDEETGVFALGGSDAFVQIDLQRKIPVTKVAFKNFLPDYVSTRTDFDILVSNDPSFASKTLLYSRQGKETGVGEWTTAYAIDDTPYRYVRIRKNATLETKTEYEIENYHQFLCICEIEVWGKEDEKLSVSEFAKDSIIYASSNEENAQYTTDGKLKDSTWNNLSQTGKAAITYTFAEPSVFTKVQIFPEFGNENARKNFNIYASESGDFDDEELIASVGEEPIAEGCFTTFTVENLKQFKAVKIESNIDDTPEGEMGIAEVRIIFDNSAAAVEVLTSSPFDGEKSVTNIDGKHNFIEIELNRSVDEESVNAESIIIRNLKDNTEVSDWQVYSVNGKKIKIDISSLLSGTEYEVTVTENVTASGLSLEREYIFSFTTGTIINMPYEEGRVIKNISEKKNVAGKIISGSGPFSNIVDGNESNIAYGDPNIQIDLGNYYDVVAIELLPQESSPDNNWLLQNLNILGSKTDMDIFNMTQDKATQLKLATYPSNSVKREIFVLGSPQKTRYVGLWRAGTYVVISEIKVYAMVDEDFGEWTVSNDEVTGSGTYTFSIPVINYASDNSYYMTVGAYDKNGTPIGNIVSGDVLSVKDKRSELTKSITVDGNVSAIEAMLFESRESMKLLADVKRIVAVNEEDKVGGETSSISFVTNDSGFKLSLLSKENTDFTATSRVSVAVLRPDNSFDDNLMGNAFDSALCYSRGASEIPDGECAYFSFKVNENMPYGKYPVKVTVTDENRKTKEYFFAYNHISPAEIVECVEEFKTFDEETDDMKKLVDKYVTQKEFINFEQIPELKEEIPASFEKYYTYFRDSYLKTNEMTSITDVVKCLNGAYVLATFDEGNRDEAETALKKYSSVLKDIYDTNADTDKFLTVFADLKENIQDADSLEEILKWSGVLSYIQGGTAKDIRETIEKHAEMLGCDLEYAENKGISLNQIAMYINNEKASGYYYESLGEEFKKITDSLYKPSGSGGNKNVSSGGGFSDVLFAGSVEVENDGRTDATPIEKAMPFNDITNIAWAKDHIVSLYEKGIVSGAGDNRFEPDREVTREEFVKMIVEALGINALTGKYTEFDDCAQDAWYNPYIQIASSNKIIKGTGKKLFGVGQTIKRQDVAVIIENALEVKKINMKEGKAIFTDSDMIDEYAKSSVQKLSESGILNGFSDGSFNPKAGTSRAQAAVIISKTIRYTEEVSK